MSPPVVGTVRTPGSAPVVARQQQVQPTAPPPDIVADPRVAPRSPQEREKATCAISTSPATRPPCFRLPRPRSSSAVGCPRGPGACAAGWAGRAPIWSRPLTRRSGSMPLDGFSAGRFDCQLRCLLNRRAGRGSIADSFRVARSLSCSSAASKPLCAGAGRAPSFSNPSRVRAPRFLLDDAALGGRVGSAPCL